jgi:hypothetical protein
MVGDGKNNFIIEWNENRVETTHTLAKASFEVILD